MNRRFSLCALSVLVSLCVSAAEGQARAPFASLERAHPHFGAFVVRQVNGAVACDDATQLEGERINRRPQVQTTVFGEDRARVSTNAGGGGANLNIILRGTAQLDANPQAKAAFERAAAIWEAKIANPVTVFVDVDFGSTSFGEAFEEATIAQASSDYRGGDPDLYAPLRSLLAARADNAAETAIYSRLPANTLPTDRGNTTVVLTPSIGLRAMGALPATAQSGDSGPRISFNSAFAYDFDPANGISPNLTDFEGVVVHEIGHMLGFVSTVGIEGENVPVLAGVFDWFRFRPGVTNATFTSAQRVQSPGGSHVYFSGSTALAMSTAKSDGTAGDGQQASHWKDDAQTGVRIGIMDPTLNAGARSELTAADLEAFNVMGFTINGGAPVTPAPAAPTNLTASATSSSTVSLTWTDNASNESNYRVEQKVGAAFVEIGTVSANATGVTVEGLSAGTSYTFRIRASNGAGNSAYSNEASATTSGGTSTGPCVSNATTVCLLSNRFRVSVDFFNPIASQAGTFKAARLLPGVGNPDTALFGFDNAQAVELVVRIQDTRPFAPRFDIYYGAMTDFPYTVNVTDTQTGVSRSYAQTGGAIVGGVDRSSFPASVFGSDDRLVSGGTDSFFDTATIRDDPTLLRIKGGTASAAGSVEEAITTTFGSSGLPALNDVDSRRHSKVRVNAPSPCTEAEPNNTILLADTLTSGVPCTGNASITDSANTITVTYDNGTTDKIEDVFKITLASSATITGTLTFTTASADLDLFLFRVNGSTLDILKAANGATTTETLLSNVLTAGTYYVGVSAFSGSSNYTVTATVSGSGPAVPTAPANLRASLTSATEATLLWTDSANETGYVVERKIDGGAYVEIGTLAANATGATVGPLQQGVTYTFRVKATNSTGSSPYSNEASVTTTATSGPCVANATTVCLLNNRFRVSINFFNPIANQGGTFQAARLSTGAQNPDTALFGFSNAQAVEVVVRVQDTRPFAPRFDIYYGAMTDFPYTVNVTDTTTGVTRQYAKSGGAIVGGVDRTSFPAN